MVHFRSLVRKRGISILSISDCNFLANLSFTRPRLSPIFLTRLHETLRPESIETSTNSIFLAFLLIEILIYTKQKMAFKLNFVAYSFKLNCNQKNFSTRLFYHLTLFLPGEGGISPLIVCHVTKSVRNRVKYLKI